MATTDMTVPTVESEAAGMKLTPAQRARLIAAASADATKRAAERVQEARRRTVVRTKAVRERLRKPVPMSVGAAIGGAAAEVVRRELAGRFTSNIYGQALGVAAVGALAQVAEESLGVPGLGSLGVGHMGVAGMLATVKLAYDHADKRDPLAVALEGTTRKARKDAEKKRKEKEEEEEAEKEDEK